MTDRDARQTLLGQYSECLTAVYGIEAAFPEDQFPELAPFVTKSLHPERSGDIYVV